VVIDDSEENKEKGIKGFWKTALKNHDELCYMISDNDAEVLRHLINIRSVEGEDNVSELHPIHFATWSPIFFF
jgi:hypothetical protein